MNMITQEQANYVIDNLLGRNFIRKTSGGCYGFTRMGNEYTHRCSGDGWLRLNYYSNNLWVPDMSCIALPIDEWVWSFRNYDEIKEEQYAAFCKYFEIPIEENNQVILDDDDDFVV